MVSAVRRFAFGIGWLAILASITACGGTDDADDASRELSGGFSEIPGMEISTGQVPISPSDHGLIGLAETRLVAQCMDDEGFDFSNVVQFETDNHVTDAPRYLTPAELRRSGYQYDWAAAAASFLAINGPDGIPTFIEDLSPSESQAYNLALFGPPDDDLTLALPGGSSVDTPASGCRADARVSLYGSLENAVRYDHANQQLLQSGVSEQLADDDSYAEAMGAWQACMRDEGFDVEDSTDYGLGWLQAQGGTALVASGSGQTAVTAEIIQAVTVADADCQESSGLFEVRERLLPDAEEEVAAELGFEMSEYIAFQNAVLEHAKQVP